MNLLEYTLSLIYVQDSGRRGPMVISLAPWGAPLPLCLHSHIFLVPCLFLPHYCTFVCCYTSLLHFYVRSLLSHQCHMTLYIYLDANKFLIWNELQMAWCAANKLMKHKIYVVCSLAGYVSNTEVSEFVFSICKVQLPIHEACQPYIECM